MSRAAAIVNGLDRRQCLPDIAASADVSLSLVESNRFTPLEAAAWQAGMPAVQSRPPRCAQSYSILKYFASG